MVTHFKKFLRGRLGEGKHDCPRKRNSQGPRGEAGDIGLSRGSEITNFGLNSRNQTWFSARMNLALNAHPGLGK